MSGGRPKRQVTVPRKFPIEEGYMLPDSPSKLQVRRVLRILKPPDLQRKLEDATVYVVWPDDALWYEATIQETMEDGSSAKLFYTDTSEEEEVDLQELIQEKQIAFLEMRSLDHELKEDELDADKVISAPSVHTRSDETEAEEEEEESAREGSSRIPPSLLHDDEEEEEDAMLKGFSRPGLSKQQSFPEEGPGSLPTKSSEEFLIPGEQLSGTLGRAGSGGSGLEVLNPSVVSLLGSSQSLPSESSPRKGLTQPYDLMKRKRQIQEGLMRSSSYEVAPFKMTAVREKIIEQLKADLEIAKNEQRKETEEKVEQDSETDIKDLATSIEVEILKLCGGENTEYKNKFRTLHFNLKDARNPELRGRVLEGEISPERLVRMTPQDLASQELSQWRQRKSEELLKATVLDEEAAAKFSTAAALKQLDSRREKRLKEETHDSGSVADIVEVSTERPEMADVMEEAEEDQTRLTPGVSRLDDEETALVSSKDHHRLESEERPHVSVQPSDEVTEDVIGEAKASQVECIPGETTEQMDVDAVPDWAEEVLEDPSESVFIPSSTAVENVPTPLVLYSPKAADERNDVGFGPVPIEAKPVPVTDLTPLILRGEFSDSLGDVIWEGEISFGEHHTFKAECQAIAGKCSLKEILTSTQVTVQGRMNLRKVEEFLEKLRMSKSRSVTIGILRTPLGASESDVSAIQQQVTYHQSRERTGAVSFGEGLEGYLVPRCLLTERLLLTARLLLENDHIPRNVESTEFLLVVVHKKDWTSQKSAVFTPPPPPPLPQIPSCEPVAQDPRLKAGLKPIIEPPPPPVVFSTPVQDSGLPAGLTLESISNLAAMLGVQNQPRMPLQQSLAAPPPIPIPPHQMTVPGPQISGTFENQQQQQQQQQIAKQIERPKFLIFDPVTGKAVPINPASVQYDPASNRVVLVGPLPPGFSIPQTVFPTPSMEMQQTSENLLTNAPGLVPLLNKQRPGEGLTEGLMENLGQSGTLLAGRLHQSGSGPGMSGRMMKTNLQQGPPRISSERGSFRGRGSFRRGGRSSGRFDINFSSSTAHNINPQFPDSDAL